MRKPSQKEKVFLTEVRAAASEMENKTFGDMYYEGVRRKLLDNDSALFDFMAQLERTPVDIETFLDSPEFFGATDLSMWPEVRKEIIETNCNWWQGTDRAKGQMAYDGTTLCGATSTGKSTIAIVTTLFHAYLLSCLKNPQAVYGLPKPTSIVFAIMAAKPHVMKKVVYVPMRKFLESMPYFQKHMPPDKLIESEMYFPEKNIRIVPAGGDEDAILGEAIIGGIIDEINFCNIVLRSKKAEVTSGRAGMYDQAEQIHSTMVRRKKGRFISKGPMIGIVIGSSSTRYKGDFTDKRKKLVAEGKLKSERIYDRRQYDVWPQDRYSGETFRLMIGDDAQHDTRILKDDEVAPPNAWIENVPIEYLEDFTTRPYDALRDVLGISNNALSPFIKTRHKIHECIEAGKEMGLESFLLRDHVILGEHGMPQVKQGHYCQNPSRPRYVHIDLSRNEDRCVAKGERVLLEDRTYREIDKLRVGDRVVTHTGTAKPVVALHANGIKPVLSVDIYGWNNPLRATGNHMVWAVRRADVSYADGRLIKPNDYMFIGRSQKAAKKRYNYVPEFVRLDSLRPGDFLVTPRPAQQDARCVEDTMLTYEAGYIAGLFAAEGSFYDQNMHESVQFSLHENETKIADQLERCLQSEFGVSLRTCKGDGHRGITYRIAGAGSERLVRFLLAVVGEYSHRKTFAGVRIGDPHFTAGMCHGYVDGDGHVRYGADDSPMGFKTKSVSRAMSEQFYWALVSSGFIATLGFDEGYTDEYRGKAVVHKPVYSVSVSGVSQMEKFRFWTPGVENVPCSMAMGLESYVLSPITGVVDGGITEVFDITVADNSSYVVGNCAVHNCGLAMVRFEGMKLCQRKNGMTELLPVGVVEMSCSIAPDANNEIDVAEVRAFVKHLKTKYGYPIKSVSYDGVDSRESIQAWRKDGMRAVMISVDRAPSTRYKQVRDAYYDTRLILQDDDEVTTEILELEYDEKADKVDHPVTGRKDVSDAITGAYSNMLERRSTWNAAAIDDENFAADNRASFDERFDEARS